MLAEHPFSVSEIPLPDFSICDGFDEEESNTTEYATDCGLPYISINELDRKAQSGIKVKVFDCRFPYEYRKGHLKGAETMSTVSQLYNMYELYAMLWVDKNNGEPSENIIAFHCEFSKVRGPSFGKIFRDIDRMENIDRYPTINFPNVYIIHGGFEEIYKTRPDLCEGTYLPMRAEEYVNSGEMRRMNSFFESEITSYYRKNSPLGQTKILSASQPIIRPLLSLTF